MSIYAIECTYQGKCRNKDEDNDKNMEKLLEQVRFSDLCVLGVLHVFKNLYVFLVFNVLRFI